MNSVPVGFAPSGDVFVVPARPAEKKKRPPVRFDELGNVILPPGALDPSETTLLSRAMVLQGQEARASTDALLSTSIATPEELMAFVGGRSDLSTADILQAKTVLRSAADLRKEVTDTAQLARDQQDVIQQTIEDADAAAQQAAAAAAVAADRVATGIDGLTAAAAPVAAIAPIAPVSVSAPVAATPGGAAPGGMPVYAVQARTKLATKAQGALNVVADASSTPEQKAGAQLQADLALDGIRAYDNLYAIGLFREVMRSAKARALTPAEKADMLTVNRAQQAAGITSTSDKFNTVMSGVITEARTGATSAAAAKQAADNAAVIAAQAAALKKAAEDRAAAAAAAASAAAAKAKAEAAAKAKLVADAQAASQAAADAQAKADAAAAADAAKAAKKARQAAAAKGGMTGSGLDWREIGALAMDKAEAGDQVGALRLLADATGDGLVFPDGKLSKLYMYVRSR